MGGGLPRQDSGLTPDPKADALTHHSGHLWHTPSGHRACAEHEQACSVHRPCARQALLSTGAKAVTGEKAAEPTNSRRQPLRDTFSPPSPEDPPTALHLSEDHLEKPQTKYLLLREGRENGARVGSAGGEAQALHTPCSVPDGPTRQEEHPGICPTVGAPRPPPPLLALHHPVPTRTTTHLPAAG